MTKMSGRRKFVDCAKRAVPHRGAKFCDKAWRGKFESEGIERNQKAYLLELLDGTLVDSTALVDQVTCYNM
jgi:hypothetical protein